MARPARQIDVYLEIGQKRTFAGALAWPGWCRSAHDEAAALQALLEYGPRYAQALGANKTKFGFRAPADVSAFAIVERLTGNATTDFGAPSLAPAADAQPLDAAELRRLQTILQACWEAFDLVVRGAAGKELRKGPRGGGRDVEKIVAHVLDAEAAYVSRLGIQLEPAAVDDLSLRRQVILDGLAAVSRSGAPERGPRGGVRWMPRYFVRRTAWHVLDHTWEIEDKVIQPQS